MLPPSAARRDMLTFQSAILGREMPLTVWVPPGYEESGTERYPVLYMLHGFSGSNAEWEWWGLLTEAERLISAGELAPFLIVLPQGDLDYWVDHAKGGPQWGRYLATEVVGKVDLYYSTLADAKHRAIGGLSMGADGAFQVSLSYPGVFSIVGMHGPVLRSFETAPRYFGDRAYFNAHSPQGLARKETAAARNLIIELDSGTYDAWRGNVDDFAEQLKSLKIPYVRNLAWPGGHEGGYWITHMPDFLRFYGAAFAAHG